MNKKTVLRLGAWISNAAVSCGFGIWLLFQTIRALPLLFKPRRARDLFNLLFSYAMIGLPVTLLVSWVIGMILAIGMGVTLQEFGQEDRVGWLVCATVVREMGPLMTAFILAASLGSGIAAEIGTMKVSEEIDALEVMSISPIHFLILPRMVALVLLTPVMTIFANTVAVLGGSMISRTQFGVTTATYLSQAFDAIDIVDVLQSVLKGAVFGVIIALVGCTQGLLATGGATGVGQATRRAVVVAFLLVLVVGYILSWVIYR